ncbi:MAG: FUSC family protein [Solirubrobacterales bacterium]
MEGVTSATATRRRTGQRPKPDWMLAVSATVAFNLGALLSLLVGVSSDEAIAPGMIALLVAIAAHYSPRGVALKAAVVIGVIVVLVLMLALATTGNVIAAGVTMAVLAFLTGMGQAADRVTAGVGSVLLVGYLLPAVVEVGWDGDFVTAVSLGITGLVAGLVVAIGLILLKRKEEHEELADREPHEGASQLDRLRTAIQRPGPVRRYAIARALLLGGAMAVYQATESHAVFWVLLTMFIVLQPDAAATWQKAVQRASGVIAGALAVGLLGQVLPGEVLVGFGLVAVLVGAAYMQVDYRIWAAGISFLIIAIFGTGNEYEGGVLTWAGARVLDTLIGTTIAVVGTYLIRPRERPKGPDARAKTA